MEFSEKCQGLIHEEISEQIPIGSSGGFQTKIFGRISAKNPNVCRISRGITTWISL